MSLKRAFSSLAPSKGTKSSTKDKAPGGRGKDKAGASGSGSGSGGGSRPPKLPNAKSRTYWDNMNNREVKATRFLCHQDMNKLALLHPIRQLYQRIQWEGFLDHARYTYDLPTREFLATFEQDDEDRILVFQLFGQRHTLHYDDINRIMHTPTEDIMTSSDPDFRSYHAHPDPTIWLQITGLSEFRLRRDKAQRIVHPVWHIGHRLLSTGIFGRADPGQINITDVFFLHCMHHQTERAPDFATFFLDKCHQTRRATAGDIHIGGFITLIGLGLDLSFDDFQPVESSRWLDIEALMHMRMLERREGTNDAYNWLDYRAQPFYELPGDISDDFDASDPTTWRPSRTLHPDGSYVSDEDDMDEDESEDEQPQQPPPQQPPPQQQPHQPQPGGQYGEHPIPSYFPDTFFSDFAALTTDVRYIRQQTDAHTLAIQNLQNQSSQQSRDIEYLRQQEARHYRQNRQAWEFYHLHGHFPPPTDSPPR